MDLYPPIEPTESGFLDTGDGHRMYWEVSGNPSGVPVAFVHGGPGAGTSPAYRRFFDPAFWRIVLFDQRGCGRSLPAAETLANTTAGLIADMEALRSRLGIERWALFGGSWGSTLALAYGQTHPERVLGFVLRGIFLFRPHEVDWFLYGMGQFFPEAWQRFSGHVAPETDLLAAYATRLNDADPAMRLAAARVWCGYEEACARLMPRLEASGLDDAACLAMARIECHYMVHGGFLAEPLLDGMARIADIPAAIIQGRYDVICPPATADDLARNWRRARLFIVPDAGHSSMEPSIRSALVTAVEEIKGKVRKG